MQIQSMPKIRDCVQQQPTPRSGPSASGTERCSRCVEPSNRGVSGK